MRNNVNSIWTEARVADLVRLWDRGYSCAQIAAVIGCTRNAVIGRAHRMDLPRHNRAHNVNGQKRIVDAILSGTPRRSPSKPRTRPTVFKSRERKPRVKIPNPNAKPAIMTAVSVFTGQHTGAIRLRRPRTEMTKDEMRAMLTAAVQNTAAMEAAE